MLHESINVFFYKKIFIRLNHSNYSHRKDAKYLLQWYVDYKKILGKEFLTRIQSKVFR